MRSPRRLAHLLGLLVAFTSLLSLTGMVVDTPPAAAATKHTVTRPYIHNWVFRSTSLQRCVFVEVTGSMVGTWEYMYGDPSTDKDSLVWTGMRLKNPTIKATGWPIKGAGCDSTKRWKMKATLTQGWYQYGCKLSVSVSAGFPWSVSASPTYKCGSSKNGHRSSTEGPSTATLAQYNSGYPIKYSNTPASVRAGGVGFTGVFTVRAYTSNASDAVRYSLNTTLNK